MREERGRLEDRDQEGRAKGPQHSRTTSQAVPSPRKVSEMSSGCGSQASMPKATSPPATSLITQQSKEGLANCSLDSDHLQGTRHQPAWSFNKHSVHLLRLH